ncbi:MAG: hypothetical protein NVV57_08260 [Demequina sp.]|nr:hypothetical protein [Demequina sp.]
MTDSPEAAGAPAETVPPAEASVEAQPTQASDLGAAVEGDAAFDRPTAPLPPSNLAVGLVAGVGLGLVAAMIYAAVAIFGDREFLALGLLIGFAVAFGFHRFGHTRGIVPGIIAAVVALVLYFLAIYVEGAGAIARENGVGFMDALRFVIENNAEFLKFYFSDALSYVFLIVSVGAAFFYAYDAKSQRFDRAHGR